MKRLYLSTLALPAWQRVAVLGSLIISIFLAMALMALFARINRKTAA